MKTENLLLWLVGGFVVYKVVSNRQSQTVTPGTTYTPGSPALLPVSTQSNPVATGVNTLTSAAGSLISKLFPSASPAAAAPAAATPSAGSASPGFSQEITQLFPASSLSQTTFTPVSNGLVQQDTSALFNPPASSTFASDTSYLQMLEEDQINS